MRVNNAFNVRRLAYANPSQELALPTRHVGVEIEVEQVPPSIPTEGKWHGWDIHRDNSLRNNGLEFVTPPVYGEDLLTMLREFCSAARSVGLQGTVRTGIHIHVNMSDNDVASLEYVVGVYSIFEPMLFRLVGEWRKWSNFCAPLDEVKALHTPLRKLFNGKTEASLRSTARTLEVWRYSSLNLASLAKYGTIEFRMFPTTFDENEILLWINLLLCIVSYGERLYSEKVLPIARLKEQGLGGMADSVFGGRPECLGAIRSFLKERDADRARSFLLSCSAATSQLMEAAEVSDEGSEPAAALPRWPEEDEEYLDFDPVNALSQMLRLGTKKGIDMRECEIFQKYVKSRPPKKAKQVAEKKEPPATRRRPTPTAIEVTRTTGTNEIATNRVTWVNASTALMDDSFDALVRSRR